jgi:hypothetical protein
MALAWTILQNGTDNSVEFRTLLSSTLLDPLYSLYVGKRSRLFIDIIYHFKGPTFEGTGASLIKRELIVCSRAIPGHH